MSERVVVSPGGGIFTPEESLRAPGTGLLPGTEGGPDADAISVVAVGDLVGRVGVTEVRTPFAGQVIGWLAAAGERVSGRPAAGLDARPGPDLSLMASSWSPAATAASAPPASAGSSANGDQVATTYRSADPPPVPEGADADALPGRAVRRHRRGPGRGGLRHH